MTSDRIAMTWMTALVACLCLFPEPCLAWGKRGHAAIAVLAAAAE